MVSLKEFRWIAVMAVLVIGLSIAGTANAQGTGSIEGTVTGPAGGVVANVKVTVEGTNLVAQTVGNGFYRLATVPVGEHTVVFNYLGLQSATAAVTKKTRMLHPTAREGRRLTMVPAAAPSMRCSIRSRCPRQQVNPRRLPT